MLNSREEKIMNLLWKENNPLTSSEIVMQFESENISKITTLKAIQSLEEKGFLKVAGLKKNKNVYARMLEPNLTEEEYAAYILNAKHLTKLPLSNLIMAILGDSVKSTKNKEKVIQELEDTIQRLKD